MFLFWKQNKASLGSNSLSLKSKRGQIIKYSFCSNGRRGSRQLAVKDFGVIKEDEEHSEVIPFFLN